MGARFASLYAQCEVRSWTEWHRQGDVAMPLGQQARPQLLIIAPVAISLELVYDHSYRANT